MIIAKQWKNAHRCLYCDPFLKWADIGLRAATTGIQPTEYREGLKGPLPLSELGVLEDTSAKDWRLAVALRRSLLAATSGGHPVG